MRGRKCPPRPSCRPLLAACSDVQTTVEGTVAGPEKRSWFPTLVYVNGSAHLTFFFLPYPPTVGWSGEEWSLGSKAQL